MTSHTWPGVVSWVGQTGIAVAALAATVDWLAGLPAPDGRVTVLDCTWPAVQLPLPRHQCSHGQHPVPPAKANKRGLLTQLPELLAAAGADRKQGHRIILCDSTGDASCCAEMGECSCKSV